MNDCIFCKIVKGDIPSYKIYEDKYTYAFLDIAGDVEGHTLVIPKSHCTNVLDASNETLHHVMDTVKLISTHYVNNCKYSGVNIINATGKDAEQSVLHLHFHVFPRKFNDGVNGFPHNEKKELDFNFIKNKLQITK